MRIDYQALKRFCLSDMESFQSFGDVFNTPDGMFIYKNNDSPVLAVAHLDTVLELRHFYVNTISKDDYIFNAQLDDRLGAYIICDLLPSLGLKHDLLLTEGEEIGRSTAYHFQPSKQYNWAFSFDRKGEDVVTYQYDDKSWVKTIEQSGFKMGNGSFSDIAFLDDLGVKCMNIGTGYHGEHSDLCYARMSELKRQINRFIGFYNTNKDTRFPHVESKGYYKARNTRVESRFGDAWDDGDYTDDLYCKMCGLRIGRHQITDNFWVCDTCFPDIELCQACDSIVFAYQLKDGLCPDCLDY